MPSIYTALFKMTTAQYDVNTSIIIHSTVGNYLCVDTANLGQNYK